MLEYFPCTVDRSMKEIKRSKAGDEKSNTTETHKASRPKGRGRGGPINNPSKEMPRKPGESTMKSNNEKANTSKAKKDFGPKSTGRENTIHYSAKDTPPKNDESTIKPNNTKPSRTEAKKATVSKDNEKRSSEKTDKPTLLSMTEGVGNVSVVKEKPDASSSLFPNSVDVADDGVGKMDTSKGDSAKTENVAESAVESATEGTVENAADRKGNENFRKLN